MDVVLGSGFRDNKWILLISFGCTNVDFLGGRWIPWISLFRQTTESRLGFGLGLGLGSGSGLGLGGLIQVA